MPRFTAEKAASPERIPYHLRCKPSTPIEIPRRRRPPPSPLCSPMERPTSLELVFEMSPISPTFPPLSTVYPDPLSPSTKTKEPGDSTALREPFMYNVPVFRPCPTGNGTWARSKSSRQCVMPSRKLIPLSVVTQNRQVRRKESFPVRPNDSAHILDLEANCRGVGRTQSTTRIMGFTPINQHQPPTFDQPSKPMRRLSPTPHKSSYSSSPWILPGNIDCYEDDVSYSQVDPSMLEFRCHLLRRIGNQDSSRYASIHCCL